MTRDATSCEWAEVRAHKVVLASASDFFLGLLSQNGAAASNPNPLICLPQSVSPAALANVLDFVYSGEVAVGAGDELDVFKDACKVLGVRADFECRGMDEDDPAEDFADEVSNIKEERVDVPEAAGGYAETPDETGQVENYVEEQNSQLETPTPIEVPTVTVGDTAVANATETGDDCESKPVAINATERLPDEGQTKDISRGATNAAKPPPKPRRRRLKLKVRGRRIGCACEYCEQGRNAGKP